MFKIALVVPYSNFVENALSIFDEHNQKDNIYSNQNYVMEEILMPLEKLRQINVSADVIITRGLLSQMLSKYYRDIPIIDLSLNSIDLIRTLSECKMKFGNKKVGILTARNMIQGSEDIFELFDLPSQTYIIDRMGHETSLIEQAVADGCQVIVGGLTACRLAHKGGLEYMFIRTCKESLWKCISEAKRAIQISVAEQEKSKLMNIILDSSKEGILSVDSNKRISVFNQSAEKILKVTRSSLEQSGIQDAPFPVELKKIILDSKEYSNEIIKYHNSMLSINKSFIKFREAVVSTVITFQEMSNIQDIEFKMRKKIYLSGHVAKSTFDDIAGSSDILRKTIEKAKKFSLTSSNILLIGESGTGKEVYAQSIHNYSRRKDGPFVAVNCAAIPENLLESELFGYVSGAFTDARKAGKPGFFELAHQGTIFLDEIGELPIALQAKLLRVLQEREITRIGDDKVTPVDIRIITATNKNLEKLVEENKFREDLLYRIDVLRIRIPSLSERREDIPILADLFIKERWEGITITAEAKKVMSEYDWHGNIRQLMNICERLAVMSVSGTINADDVEAELGPNRSSFPLKEPQKSSGPASEKIKITEALKASRYNRTAAARSLGMDRTTLWRKMKQYDL